MNDAVSGWSDERVERLKKLWSDGLSASQIAAELAGGVTRNAVIGKVHRLGLSGRGKTPSNAQPRPRKATRPPSHPLTLGGGAARPNNPIAKFMAVRPEPEIQAEPIVDDEIMVPVSERVTIMELRETMCRWPIGDPTKPDFGFCGGRAVTGLPYCAAHCRVAYQPAAERKRIRA